MVDVVRTAEFVKWTRSLRDGTAKVLIAKRIDRVMAGNFGDVRSVGHGVSELRIDFGPGYRLYFTRRGSMIVVLLCGGDKSTQDRDIMRARAIASEIGGTI